MSSEEDPSPFVHEPVMVDEVATIMGRVPAGVILDATIGGGGHAAAVLESAPHIQVLGFDVDPAAVETARRALSPWGNRARVVRERFDRMAKQVGADAVSKEPARILWNDRLELIVGVMFDLGVSSHQLDTPGRGFSYRQQGPLDMRMDPSAAISARDIVNSTDATRLAELFAANGEVTFARRIAEALVDARPISTTSELSDIVTSVIPAYARRKGGHPAKRVFQALRIAVNSELDVLRSALDQSISMVAPGGRICVISYHSGEDRIVKAAMADAVRGGCVCPSGLECVCGAYPRAAFVFRGVHKPAHVEIEGNPRASAARLRSIEIVGRGEGR